MKGATARQEQLLRFIDQYTVHAGYPPTLREMANHLGASSSSGAYDHIRSLIGKGLVRRRRYTSRGTVLTAEGQCVARNIEFRRQLG